MKELMWVVRRLQRRRGFAALFVSIFGSAFGISLVVGTLAEATLGTALPYEDEELLYALTESQPEQGIERMVSSYASFVDWSERSRAFAAIGAVRPRINASFGTEGGAVRASAAIVSRSMFDALGVRPFIGRSFSAEEDRVGAGIASVVLSHGFWRDRLGADPGVVGASMELNGAGWTVVGVLPEGVSLAPHYREGVDIWYPIGVAESMFGPQVHTVRGYRSFRMIGRLTSESAAALLHQEADRMGPAFEREYAENTTGWSWAAADLRSELLRGVEGPVAALLAGGLVLFAVAVVNLIALFVQGLRRDLGELATRRALGANPEDLVRLGLMELGVLGALGGAAGIAVALAGIRLVPHWLALSLPAYAVVAFDPALAAGAFVVAQLLVLGVGLAVMSQALRRLSPALVVSGRIVGATRPDGRFTGLSLGIQVALTTVLAVGSVVAARSFVQIGSVDPGIRPDGLSVLRVDVPPETRDEAGVVSTADEILLSLESLPDVEDAFLWSPHVPAEATWFTRVRMADRPDVDDSELPAVRINAVSPGALESIGLVVLAGRDMTETDRTSGRRVVVVSETAANAWWGSPDAALGRRIRRWNRDEWTEVVGVVADAPLSGRRGEGSDFFTDAYFLFGQDVHRELVFLTRAPRGAQPAASALRGAVRAAAPDLPAYDLRTMPARLADQDALSRSAALLGMVFALTAVVLACLGLYGGISVVLARKRRELGLRQALGAPPSRVVSELVWGASKVVLGGIVAGVLLAWHALAPLDPTLFVVGPRDAASYVAGVVVMLTASFLALSLPSVRAVRTSPSVSLRDGA